MKKVLHLLTRNLLTSQALVRGVRMNLLLKLDHLERMAPSRNQFRGT